MAAPSPTARQTPTGFKMPDGYRSLVTLGLKPAIQLWEVAVKPPAYDGGEPIPTTTMHNNRWRSFEPKHLISLDVSSFTCMYDPDVFADIIGAINRKDTLTVLFPDGSTLAFFGWVQKFEPSELKEGEPPMATVAFAVSNYDSGAGAEAGPTFTAAVGT